jgi:hypothetical protein
MRLRREVGDFNFEIKNGTCTLPKNLFPEQLIGQIMIVGNVHTVITNVDGANGAATYTLTAGNGSTYTYTAATGAVATANPANPG